MPTGAATTTTVGLGVHDFGRILVDPATSHIFASSPNDSSIVVLDFSGNIVRTIGSEAGASGMAIQGHTLYVALNTMGAIDRIDTGTLTETGMLVSGLVRPRDLILAGGKLWTTTGNCGASPPVQLVKVDPGSATVTTYPFDSSTSLGYCAAFASNPTATVNWFLAWDLGLDPAQVTTFDVSSGTPVQLQTAREGQLGNLQDVAINPDGKHFITASGAPYEFDEWNVSNLAQDGIIYPANAYPTAIATSSGRGGVMGGGVNGIYDPDFYAYAIGQPAGYLTRVDFGGTSNTVPARGVAISPDGNTAFVISGGYGSGPLLNLVPIPVPGAPGPPEAVNATAGRQSAMVSWSPPQALNGSAITNYTVTSNPGNVTATTNGATSATVAPLTAGAYYTFTVTATNASGTSVPSAPSNGVVPTGPPPGPPTNVTATAGDTTATVSWTAPTDNGGQPITSYVVTPYTSGGALPSTSVSGSSPPPTMTTFYGLTNNQTYTFVVAAVSAWGQGAPSAPSNAVTPKQGMPSAPIGVNATSGLNSATVYWSAPQFGNPITSYTVTSSPGGVTATTDGSTYSTTVSPLTGGQAYTFTVTATNVLGTGPASSPSAPVVPTGPPPGPPTNVTATAGDTSATVSWTAPADDGGRPITSYVITPYVGSNPQPSKTLTGVPPPTTTTVTGLINNQTYTFVVAAVTAWGQSAPSSPSNPVTPVQGMPGPPVGVFATSSINSAHVYWSAPQLGNPISSYTVTSNPGNVTVTTNGSTYSATVSPLVAGVSYTFTVTATNALGTSPPSAPSGPVTPTGPLAGPPTNVSAVPGDSAAFVSWTPPVDTGGEAITGYQITPVLQGTSQQPIPVSGSTPNAIVTGLNNGVSYTFMVAAVTRWGPGANSAPSNPVTPIQGGNYHPLSPTRILDTRDGTGVAAPGRIGPGGIISVQITGRGGVPTTGVSAVVLNVTVTNTTAGSYLTVWPARVSRPLASNLNWTAGKTVPNLVEVALGPGGQVSAYNAAGSTDVIFDVAGWVGVASNSQTKDGLYIPINPHRVLDTRNGTGVSGGAVGPGKVISVQVTGAAGIPTTGVEAVVLNVTETNPTAGSYLTVYPAGSSPPFASNLNFVPGQTVPNRVLVKLGTNPATGTFGWVSFYNAAGTVDVIADVGGWFTDSSSTNGGTRFTGTLPTRILDTRDPGIGPLGPGQTGTLQLTDSSGQPVSGVSSVVLNVTVTNPTASSYLSLWGDGFVQPFTSDLNFTRGLTVANLVVVGLGPNASFDIYNAAGSTDVIIDLVGFYGPLVSAPSGTMRAFSWHPMQAFSGRPSPVRRGTP